MPDVDELKATAAAFDELLSRDRTLSSNGSLHELSSVAEVAELLAHGDAQETVDAIRRLAASLPPGPELPALIYQAAARIAMERPDLTQIVTGLETQLALEPADQSDWTQDEDPFLQAVGAGLLPIAGLDVQGTFHFTKVFMENFPTYSLPLGDYDLRATRWIAQLMDMGSIRAAYRQRMRELAGAHENSAPLACTRMREWAAGPPPADPTADVPWTQGLLALVRSQL